MDSLPTLFQQIQDFLNPNDLSAFHMVYLFFLFVDEHINNENSTQLILNRAMLTQQDLEGREHLHQAYKCKIKD